MALSLALPFSDGMVLQRELPVRVWGYASPGHEVMVRIQGKTAHSVADEDGRWVATLEPLGTSELEELVVQSDDERLVVHDVAVGEVFVAGGQSNMEFWMRYEKHLDEVLPACDNPRIRFMDVPKCSYPGQEEDFDYSKMGIWRKATPSDLEWFSAIGYYFARELEAELDVPVGIVGCNYGGTKSLAWMTPEHARKVQPEQTAAFERKLCGLTYEELLANGSVNPKNDKGYATWPAWNDFFLPRTRTAEEVEAFMAEEAAQASGPADVGGLSVGASSETTEVHPGLMAPTKEAPGALFTYMVERIAEFAARGVLWYQGESDDEDAGAQVRHRMALQTVIADWRDAWHTPDLPFFVVQIPGFGTWLGYGTTDYPTIRRCQQEVADSDEQVWLCSIGDVGDELDIHPKDKLVPGHRLALLALRHLYGRDVLADAPCCMAAIRDEQRVALTFENAGTGLTVNSSEVNSLEVLGQEGPIAYRWQVEGNRLTLTLDREPTGDVLVRYCQSGWYLANLVNSADIPALPFEMNC